MIRLTTGVRDYIHVMDLADGHIAALGQLDNPKSFVNLGRGKGSSVREIIRTFERISGRRVPYEIKPRRPGDIDAYYAATDHAARLMGWRATRTLDEMCVDHWRWQRTIRMDTGDPAELAKAKESSGGHCSPKIADRTKTSSPGGYPRTPDLPSLQQLGTGWWPAVLNCLIWCDADGWFGANRIKARRVGDFIIISGRTGATSAPNRHRPDLSSYRSGEMKAY